jgi:hypothetical protein
MAVMNRARRLVAGANAVALAAGVWFAIQAGGRTMLGPARTDDLPYGDLLTMTRPGAVVWSLIAVAGLAVGLAPRRSAALAVGVAWATVAGASAVVVVSEGSLFGYSRPGVIAAASALALVSAIAGSVAAVWAEAPPVPARGATSEARG